MSSDLSPLEIAKARISSAELRCVVDAAFEDREIDSTDPRLIMASDLICDAAMEVVVLRSSTPSITKILAIGDADKLPFNETGVVAALWKMLDNGTVTMDELQQMLLGSAVADVVQKRQSAGHSAEEICASEITLAPVGFNAWLDAQRKPNSWIKRLFGR